MHDRREWWGWVLFLLSAVFFLVVAIRDRDVVVGAGSVAFFAACVLFLHAYPKKSPDADTSDIDDL